MLVVPKCVVFCGSGGRGYCGSETCGRGAVETLATPPDSLVTPPATPSDRMICVPGGMGVPGGLSLSYTWLFCVLVVYSRLTPPTVSEGGVMNVPELSKGNTYRY